MVLNTLQTFVSLKMLEVALFPIAGETFVTRKVTRSVAQIHLGYMESVSCLLFHSYGYY